MKLLRLSLPLILISCAFPLSRANAVEKQQSEKPLSKAEQKSQSDIQKDQSKNQNKAATSVGQEAAKAEKQPEPKKPQEHWYDFLWQSNMPNWIAIVGWTIAAFIAWCTLKGMKEQSEATKAAANASIKSAEVAELALKTDRPYLLIEKTEMFGVHKEKEGFSGGLADYNSFEPRVRFTFRNFGKGPALIKEVALRLWPLEHIPAAGDFADCRFVEIDHAAVGAGGTWRLDTDMMDGIVNQGSYDDIVRGKKEITIWGYVRYQDVFELDEPYETAFCWRLPTPFELDVGVNKPPIIVVPELSRGPSTHNYTKGPN